LVSRNSAVACSTHPGQHRVEAVRHRSDLVAAVDGRARGEVAGGGPLHGAQDAAHRREHEVTGERVDHGHEDEDGQRGEEERRRPHLVAHAPDGVHGDRHHHRAVGPVVALEGHRHQAHGAGQHGGDGPLARLDGPARQDVDHRRRRALGAGGDGDSAALLDAGDGEAAHRRHHALEVGQHLVEIRARGQALALGDLGGHAEGRRGRRLQSFVLHHRHDDAALDVSHSPDDEGGAERNHHQQPRVQREAGAAGDVGQGGHRRAGRGARAS
jgi:hypothetical protein